MSHVDYQSKYERRRALRDRVETYWLEEPKRPSGSLDASLKKHTTLINRIKSSLLVGPAEALIKEIDGLTLTKYLEEIAAAIVEGASKGKGDAEVAVDVIVHLHTRLTPEFLPLVLSPLVAALAPGQPSKDGDKDDKERVARQRLILRIVAELGLISAWPEGIKKGAGEVGKVLQAFMSNDPQYNNIPLPIAFLKYFGRAYLGPLPESKEPLSEGVEELVPVEIQAKMRQLFTNYFEGASKTLVKGQNRLLEQDRRNHEAYIKSGEIFEDRQQAYEKMTKAVERLSAGVQSLSELLGLPMPTLPTAASLAKSGLQIVEGQSSFTVREDGAVPGGIWDDDEERRFYEEILDLKQVVPAGLLGLKEELNVVGSADAAESNAESEAKRKQDEEDIRRQLEQLEVAPAETGPQAVATDAMASAYAESPTVESSTLPDDAEATAPVETGEDDGMQSGPAARLNILFAALPEAVNREMIDKLAVEFASLNSKAARKRLVRFIGAVPKNRTDLLPHYARFVATLNPYMPDVGTGILDILEEELRYLQRKRHVRELDGVRLKNVRFYGELAKFKVAKPYAILHVLKVFLDDFKFNIENIANLLENCGRFLLRYEGSAKTAKDMVELMRRKQATSHLDQRHNVMLENAFYMCNPPEQVTREVIELSPMQSFIQHLLHDVLAKRTLDKVTKLLRKLHWEDPEVYDYLVISFTQVWEIRYGNIPFLAAIVYDLQRYHPEFSVIVVDQVMENIRTGLEENIFKHNQRRIASLRYLGELYMYRVINAAVIFDVLWSLVSFGHGEGLPVPGRDSPIDSVDDFFRVRLICTLLDTCGTCFDRGSGKRKLDQFLVVFQLYITCKSELPMDVEFMLNDTFDTIRPKAPRLKTFNEAAAAVDALLADQAQNGNDAVSDDGSDGEARGGNGEPEEEDERAEGRIDDVSEREDDLEDDVVFIRDQKANDEMDQEAEGDFDREFARMLTDTTDVRRSERKTAPIFDTAVPLIKKRQAAPATQSPTPTSAQRGTVESGGGAMNFTLLSKKGNKQQLRTLDIPLDSAIALNSMSHQQRNKAEQEQLKRLVLQNERRQEKSEMQAIQDDARQRGIKLRFVPS